MDNKLSIIITSKDDIPSFEYLMLQIYNQSMPKSFF